MWCGPWGERLDMTATHKQIIAFRSSVLFKRNPDGFGIADLPDALARHPKLLPQLLKRKTKRASLENRSVARFPKRNFMMHGFDSLGSALGLRGYCRRPGSGLSFNKLFLKYLRRFIWRASEFHNSCAVTLQSQCATLSSDAGDQVLVVMKDALPQHSIGAPNFGGNFPQIPLLDVGFAEQGIIIRSESAKRARLKEIPQSGAEINCRTGSSEGFRDLVPAISFRSQFDHAIIEIIGPLRALILFAHPCTAGSGVAGARKSSAVRSMLFVRA